MADVLRVFHDEGQFAHCCSWEVRCHSIYTHILRRRSASAEAYRYVRNTVPVPNVVSRLEPGSRLESGLGYFLILGFFLDGHVFELAGFEDFTAFETLY